LPNLVCARDALLAVSEKTNLFFFFFLISLNTVFVRAVLQFNVQLLQVTLNRRAQRRLIDIGRQLSEIVAHQLRASFAMTLIELRLRAEDIAVGAIETTLSNVTMSIFATINQTPTTK
jgi:hypothetical protein